MQMQIKKFKIFVGLCSRCSCMWPLSVFIGFRSVVSFALHLNWLDYSLQIPPLRQAHIWFGKFRFTSNTWQWECSPRGTCYTRSQTVCHELGVLVMCVYRTHEEWCFNRTLVFLLTPNMREGGIMNLLLPHLWGKFFPLFVSVKDISQKLINRFQRHLMEG